VELECDVLVVGAGCGGLAAALTAARTGCSVVLTEPTRWVGGQLASQAVLADEHPWIESTGAPRGATGRCGRRCGSATATRCR
jgi:flavin-dependent dehydrogenase